MRWTLLVPSLVAACALRSPAHDTLAAGSGGDLVDLELAPPATPRAGSDPVAAELAHHIDGWFQQHGTRRLHVQLDRPLFRPGETVWVKTWSVASRAFGPSGSGSVTYELVDPRGNAVETKLVAQSGSGTATNDFEVPADAPGGRWLLRATLDTGEIDERPFVVSSYQAPRVHKTLDFVREAYGPGERVEALVELTSPDGAPLADRDVRAIFQVDGATVVEGTFRTDGTGAVVVSGELPAKLTSGDGLLSVLVDDGGTTESISRSIPIVVADLQLAFFPEGGDLVSGLPGRVYFEAKDRHGEPADATVEIVDDRGAVVTAAGSVHDGLGRFAFTPARGRSYHARVTAPVGVAGTYPLPAAVSDGCTLRSYDDIRSESASVRVGVRCTESQVVSVVSTLRDATLDAGRVKVVQGAESVVYLSSPKELANAQGAARITVFDAERRPLAERLVYRNAGRNLKVELTADREQYGPRDPVTVKVRTTDPDGAPVAAELALAVVDDAVLGLADDEEGNLLTRMYLEPELVESPDDPAWYFDADEPLAARGLDLVLGTKGWRRFEWEPVFAPPAPVVYDVPTGGGWFEGLRAMPGMAPQAMPVEVVSVADAVPESEERARPRLREEKRAVDAKENAQADMPAPPPVAGRAMFAAPPKVKAAQLAAQRQGGRAARDDWDGEDFRGPMGGERANNLGWAPVRAFPVPDHGPFTGVRTDFRDTVYWAPEVHTGADGAGEVTFLLSDAVTNFRLTAEGLGGGFAAHGEATLASVLPVSVAVKLPPAVSAGDELLLPVTVTSSRANALDVGLRVTADSDVFTVAAPSSSLQVGSRGSATRFVPVTIGSGRQTVKLTVTAEGGGMADTLIRPIEVVPPGFPRTFSAAGELQRSARHVIVLDTPIEDSLVASVQWQPSPVATLVSGLDGLIREPGGCFEQTSSTNWPNVAILKYLEAHEETDPRLRANSGSALERGYGLLTGYQISAGGFETFGQGPGKEALSAFGLLEFADMRHVYPVADAVLDRNVKYLLGARDGGGGFTNSGESSHGYGSAPKPVLDGFITWSLVATGHGDDLGKEVAQQAVAAKSSKDPYVLALATRTLVRTKHPGASAAIERLVDLQAADGSFPGAESSITRSYEANLLVESTALAASALMEAGRVKDADLAVKWIVANRQGGGTWGATQATALALEALTTHAELSAVPRSAGEFVVKVGGKVVGTVGYEADQSGPLRIDGLEAHLKPGRNELVLEHPSGAPMPYTVDVRWTTMEPKSDPGAELRLTTTLDRTAAKMGETVRLTARLENRTGKVVPSPIARINLPAGLEAQTWQLEELRKRGVVAFYETRPREVTLYWEGQHGDEVHEVALDLLASVPGRFTGAASSAWPYYDDDERAFAAGLKVAIAKP